MCCLVLDNDVVTLRCNWLSWNPTLWFVAPAAACCDAPQTTEVLSMSLRLFLVYCGAIMRVNEHIRESPRVQHSVVERISPETISFADKIEEALPG